MTQAAARAHVSAMPDTVPVTLDLPPAVAAALESPVARERAARLLARTVAPAGVADLFAAMDALSDEARRRGLTDEILQAELDAHIAERRGQRPAGA